MTQLKEECRLSLEGETGNWVETPHAFLGGGFKDFLFSPLFGEDSHFD